MRHVAALLVATGALIYFFRTDVAFCIWYLHLPGSTASLGHLLKQLPPRYFDTTLQAAMSVGTPNRIEAHFLLRAHGSYTTVRDLIDRVPAHGTLDGPTLDTLTHLVGIERERSRRSLFMDAVDGICQADASCWKRWAARAYSLDAQAPPRKVEASEYLTVAP